MLLSSGHVRASSSVTESSGQGGTASPSSTPTTCELSSAAAARLQPQHERLIHAITKLVAEKAREYNFSSGSLQVMTDTNPGTYFNPSNAGPFLAMLFGSFTGGTLRLGVSTPRILASRLPMIGALLTIARRPQVKGSLWKYVFIRVPIHGRRVSATI